MLARCLAAALLLQAPAAAQDAGRPSATPQKPEAQSVAAPANRPPELVEADELQKRVAALYGEGKYAEAIPPAERVLALREKAHGPDHLEVAPSLNNLAKLYESAGDPARAEPLYLRSLAVSEKALGPDHTFVALALNNLAGLYKQRGDFARAEPLFRRAVAIYEKALGPEHPNTAVALNNLANLYDGLGDLERAEPLYLRSLAIREKAHGPDHPRVASVLNNLGMLYKAKGDVRRAAPLLERALAISEKTLGAEHPEVATALNNLAIIHMGGGDYASAEPLSQRALTIYRKMLGPDHPEVAKALGNLSTLYEARGDVARAVEYLSRAEEVRERNLSLVLAAGSERQKLAYLANLTGETSATVSLHARSAPSDPRALRLSLTNILRRKGRALDAMSDQLAALRARLDPQDRSLLDQLSAAQSELSSLVLGGPGGSTPGEHRAAVSRLEAEAERLLDAVSRRSAEFRARTRAVTIEQVREALPPGSALVEIFSYYPFDPKAKSADGRFGLPRYVAYVLGKGGEPLWADLGAASEIDAYVLRFLSDLKCPQEVSPEKKCRPVAEVMGIARAVDERVMRPVRALLGDAKHVFVSPDGLLNLVPFAALVDEQARYLVESYSLTYLTSGRDLLRMQHAGESRQPPLVIGDPLFGESLARGNPPSPGARPSRSTDTQAISFQRLKGTAEEARAVGSILTGARVLTQSEATEQALKQASSPRVLHVATHGFFLPDEPAAESGAPGAGLRGAGDGRRVIGRAENPLLRSGLALAGANAGRSAGGEDAILTALEASALDLWGTKLVVLSACETGVGEVRTGDGVYGLRRALALAGSESQVMSLWKVSDDATRDLMVSYYKRLRAGEGRTEALRRVQLEMLRGGARKQAGAQRGLSGSLGATADRSHPYFWAAFIQSGDWRPMDTRPAGVK